MPGNQAITNEDVADLRRLPPRTQAFGKIGVDAGGDRAQTLAAAREAITQGGERPDCGALEPQAS